MKKILILTIAICSVLLITGCQKEKIPPRDIKFGITYEIENHETVKLPDGTLFTVTQLGNTTCDRDVEICPFDGLRVYYELVDGENIYDQTNVKESDYIVKTGRTDYKTFVDVTISKRSE